MKAIFLRHGLLLAILIMAASSNAQVTDASGNAYPTKKFGDKEWMTMNLKVTKFRNGDEIPQAADADAWKEADKNEKPAWCYVENDQANGEKYGLLYNFYAVADPRGLAPEGWHVASGDEWKMLKEYLRSLNPKAGNSLGIELMSKDGWVEATAGVERIGFDAVPAGHRNAKGGFKTMLGPTLGTGAFYWRSEGKSSYAGTVTIGNNTGSMGAVMDPKTQLHKSYGCSVRCVKD